MTVKAAPNPDNNQGVIISVSGRFDYSVHKEFRQAYSNQETDINHFIVDLSQTEYMDSSALGMLLLIKEFAEKKNGSVAIHNPRPMVKKVLEIANFNRFFELSSNN